MLKFTCDKRYNDGTPIIKDAMIVEYAEAVLEDYNAELLNEPGQIDCLHFIESYLGADLDFLDIYYEKNKIAGATVFNDEQISIFDKDNMRVSQVEVPANTVIIDNETMKDGKEGFARFTQGHEAGHFCMHPEVYRTNPDQISIFDLTGEQKPKGGVVLCQRAMIERKKTELVTQEDFREHQANVFSAALIMPRPAFIKYAKECLIEADMKAGGKPLLVVPNEESFKYDVSEYELMRKIARMFGISHSAAEVQLRRVGLMITEDEYNSIDKDVFSVAF